MNALLKSYEYVKGKWGGVFWRFFFINALSLIIGLIIVLVIEFVFGLKYFGRLVLALSGIFLSPLIWAYSFSLYNNLKASKGEIVFVPTGGQKKAKFIAVVILGVLFIPAILFSIVFLSLSSAREKARDARREADIRQIQIGLKLYYDRYGSYPFSLNELSSYWPAMPVDPKTNLPYQYQRRGDTDYQLCVRFETKTQKCVTSQF